MSESTIEVGGMRVRHCPACGMASWRWREDGRLICKSCNEPYPDATIALVDKARDTDVTDVTEPDSAYQGARMDEVRAHAVAEGDDLPHPNYMRGELAWCVSEIDRLQKEALQDCWYPNDRSDAGLVCGTLRGAVDWLVRHAKGEVKDGAEGMTAGEAWDRVKRTQQFWEMHFCEPPNAKPVKSTGPGIPFDELKRGLENGTITLEPAKIPPEFFRLVYKGGNPDGG